MCGGLLCNPKARACGPEFPNNLLDLGDEAVLVAPEANFYEELERMDLVPTRFAAVPRQGEGQLSFADQTIDGESNDLLTSLKRAKVSREELERIRREHAGARGKLRKYLAEKEARENLLPWQRETGENPDDEKSGPPKFPTIEMPNGLPKEFCDYLEGALAWHNPAVQDKAAARQAWERLLARPTEERRFKSTWAAFMLAKAWEEEDHEQAVTYCKQVRELAAHAFEDSVGLAAASLGIEGRIRRHQKDFVRAIELYLEQLATGDDTARTSLLFVAAEASKQEPAVLEKLATNSRTRRVVTAYIISSPSQAVGAGEHEGNSGGGTRAWLEAVERVDVKDVESAEQFALAAYQADEMDLAQRWIKRAPGSVIGQWLQAKLLFRANKTGDATGLLKQILPRFPIQPPDTNELGKASLEGRLCVALGSGDFHGVVAGNRQALGELGVLHLARREYAEALDALLRAGFWMDAAYVAERVLTLDELKAYVDRSWPAVSEQQEAEEKEIYRIAPGTTEQVVTSPVLLRTNLRYLLGRRLMRALRGDEARSYYPAEWLTQFDALCKALQTGWSDSTPTNERASALFEAAWLARTNGMELLATEVEPDWHIHLGGYAVGVAVADRATNANSKILKISADESSRVAGHRADPEERFHYRYQAAFLALEAAKLMPNNSDATARVLWTAGCWLKSRDPQTADIFYKALVRRNRRTALGAEADRRRWFPDLDADGNIAPREASAEPQSTPSAEETIENEPQTEEAELPQETAERSEIPEHTRVYLVQSGDSLLSIATRWRTTIEQLRDLNHGLPPRLQVGSRILVPAAD